MMENQSHKLVIDITDEQYKKLRQILPHGTKKQLFQALIDSLIELHRTEGLLPIMGLIRQEDVGFKDLLAYDRADKQVTHNFISLLAILLPLVGINPQPLTTYSECVSAVAKVTNEMQTRYDTLNRNSTRAK